ncbi:MAG TPA: hypothetical protein VK815_12080 [Candidatus Acidoferrales bacterium]|jgi:hypothetical protein|nr:hypothetical protein [Candidatus Acidoferrales bacterium]
MKTNLGKSLLVLVLLFLAALASAIWLETHPKPNEAYIRLNHLPGVSQEVLVARDKLFHVEEPVLYNQKTGMAVFVVEILSRRNFGSERFLTFGGDAKSILNFVREIKLVNNGPSRVGSAGSGMMQGVEGLITGVWELLRHPINTAQGLGSAAVGLAYYVKDTPTSKIQTDVVNLANAYYINRACQIADQHGLEYFELKTESGRAAIYGETNWKLGGQSVIEMATLLVPFSKIKYASDVAEVGIAAEIATETAEAANTAKRMEQAGMLSKEEAGFSKAGSFFPQMVGKMNATLARLKDAVVPRHFRPPVATLGKAATFDYKLTFFKAHPDLEGKVVVHHAVEQQAVNKLCKQAVSWFGNTGRASFSGKSSRNSKRSKCRAAFESNQNRMEQFLQK